MRDWRMYLFSTLLFTLCSTHCVSGFSWNLKNIFEPQGNSPGQQTKRFEEHHERISHQAAADPYQDTLLDDQLWFDENGTPLFYGAWRTKPGKASPEPTARSVVSIQKARVACWPSSGGIWIKHADLVDLDFLRLDRFVDTPRQFNQTAEDEFCTRLRMIGADWWRLPAPFEKREQLGKEQYACDTIEDCFVPDFQNRYLVAWPATEEYACFVSIARAKPQSETKWIHYYNSMTMEERCDSIMALEGLKCRCENSCPDLDNMEYRKPDFCGS